MAPKNKVGSTNSSSSSSSGASSTPASVSLTSKETKKILVFVGQMRGWLESGKADLDMVRSYIKAFNSDLISEAINGNYIEYKKYDFATKISISVNVSIMFHAACCVMTTTDSSKQSLAINILDIFNEYGAKVHEQKPSPLQAIFVDYRQPDAFYLPNNVDKLLSVLIKNSEPVKLSNATHNSPRSLAHMAAEFEWGCLEIILRRWPQLLNEKDSTGCTALDWAISSNKKKNVLLYLNKYPDSIKSQLNDCSLLIGTLSILNRLVNEQDKQFYRAFLKRLLIDGCSIGVTICPTLLADKEVLTTLSRAGYFIDFNHCSYQTHLDLYEIVIPDFRMNIEHFLSKRPHSHHDSLSEGILAKTVTFFTLVDEHNKDNVEHIFFREDLLATKISPSRQDIERIYRSFMEVLHYYREVDHSKGEELQASPETLLAFKDNHLLYLNEFFSAFKQKYPIDHDISFRKTLSKSQEPAKFNLLDLCKIIYTASLSPIVPALLAKYQKSVLSVLESDSPLNYTQDQLKELIGSISQVILDVLKPANNDRMDQNPFYGFGRKVISAFVIKVVGAYLSRATIQEIELVYNKVHSICFQLATISFSDTKKSNYRYSEFIDTVIDFYGSEASKQIYKNRLRLVKKAQELLLFQENCFFPEMTCIVDYLNKNESYFSGKEDDMGGMTIILLIRSLVLLSISKEFVHDQYRFVESIERISKINLFKRPTLEVPLKRLNLMLENMRAEISVCYQSMVAHLALEDEFGIYRLIECSGQSLRFSIKSDLDVTIDAQRLKLLLKGSEYLFSVGNQLEFRLHGLSASELDEALAEVRAITVDQICVQLKKADQCDDGVMKPESSDKETSASTYLPEVTTYTQSPVKKSSPSKSKENPSVADPILHSRAIKEPVKSTHDQIVAELKRLYPQIDVTQLFHIDHKYLPENRRYLCYGYWGEISGASSSSMNSTILKAHHDLALSGHYAVHSKNENGLRPTIVFDEQRKTYVEGIKTKFAKGASGKGDVRVNAAPVYVNLKSGERVLLYPFGQMSKHDEDIPKTNPLAILGLKTNNLSCS